MGDGGNGNGDGNGQRKLPHSVFVKDDPRINRRGRPKGFDTLRALALKICAEIVTNPETKEKISVAEDILREMRADPKQRKDLLEIAYGSVPKALQVTEGMEPIVICEGGGEPSGGE